MWKRFFGTFNQVKALVASCPWLWNLREGLFEALKVSLCLVVCGVSGDQAPTPVLVLTPPAPIFSSFLHAPHSESTQAARCAARLLLCMHTVTVAVARRAWSPFLKDNCIYLRCYICIRLTGTLPMSHLAKCISAVAMFSILAGLVDNTSVLVAIFCRL